MIIILAQGKGSRWIPRFSNPRDAEKQFLYGIPAPCRYKQLIPLSGRETLLSRTLRQLRELESPPDELVLVAPRASFGCLGVNLFTLREPTGSIIQGMLRLRSLWMDRENILFILGDVAFSNFGIKNICSHQEEGIFFYGRNGPNRFTGKEAKEIFSLRVHGSRATLEHFFKQLILLVNSPIRKPESLKLWDLYHEMELVDPKPKFVTIDDYTDDIDSPEAYVKFFPKLLENIYEDDKYRD